MAEKNITANTPNFYTQLIFWQWLKTGLAKTPNNQKRKLARTLTNGKNEIVFA